VPGSGLGRRRAWLQANALFVVGVAAVLTLCFVGIPTHLGQDGWLALLAGRIVSAHGIPHHDYLTVMAQGVQWTDQQWLAQLLMYSLWQLGGLQVLTVVYVLVTGAAFAAALAAARNLGGQDLHILMVLPAGSFFYLATAVSIRTQGFIYPLFVATVWLLASEFPRARIKDGARGRPSPWRAYLVFPILLLWSNLHGSVTLGVGIVVLFGVSTLVNDVVDNGLRGLGNVRAWSFVLLSPLTLFASPYGFSMVHYYSVTLMNSHFGNLVAEWKPVTDYLVLAIPMMVLIATTAVILARTMRRTPLFDYLLLATLAVGAVIAVRNITWFGLATVILLPPAISRFRNDRPAPLRNARINRILAETMIILTVLTAVFVLTRPSSWFESSYPQSTITTVQRLVDQNPGVKIFADVRYADWMVWHDPALGGRIAYDTSLELLTPAQLKAIALLSGSANPSARRILKPYGIWVLYPGNHLADKVLLSQPGVQTVVKNKRVIIATNHLGGAVR